MAEHDDYTDDGMGSLMRNISAIANRALRGVDLGDGPVQCTIHHGAGEITVSRGMEGVEPPAAVTKVDVFLEGDLPDAAFSVRQDGRVLREGRLGRPLTARDSG